MNAVNKIIILILIIVLLIIYFFRPLRNGETFKINFQNETTYINFIDSVKGLKIGNDFVDSRINKYKPLKTLFMCMYSDEIKFEEYNNLFIVARERSRFNEIISYRKSKVSHLYDEFLYLYYINNNSGSYALILSYTHGIHPDMDVTVGHHILRFKDGLWKIPANNDFDWFSWFDWTKPESIKAVAEAKEIYQSSTGELYPKTH